MSTRPDSNDALSVRSMTGYAVVTRDTPAGRLSVELRSVNSRYLDITMRIADEFRAVEPALRQLVAGSVQRGKIECRVALRAGLATSSTSLNDDALGQLEQLERAIRSRLPRAVPLATAEILRWPGVLAEPISADSLQPVIMNAASEALHEFVVSRAREGAALATGILGRAQAIEEIVERIALRAPELLAQHERKLVERLQGVLQMASSASECGPASASTEPPIPINETMARIRQEVTLHGMRIDVHEELDRLRSHVAELRRALGGPGPVGKRLDFLLQEFNREANTIGSKAAAIELTQASIDLKLLIEQIREQVQNIE